MIDDSSTVPGWWMNNRENKGSLVRPVPFVNQEVSQTVDGVGIILSSSTVKGYTATNFIASQAWKLKAADVQKPLAAYSPVVVGFARHRAARSERAGRHLTGVVPLTDEKLEPLLFSGP
jgi:hypothetical protein